MQSFSVVALGKKYAGLSPEVHGSIQNSFEQPVKDENVCTFIKECTL